MFIIGITGGIGCGKSTVAALCKEAGLKVLDADAISREITRSGGVALPEIVDIFGMSVLNEKGDLDRSKMAKTVFKDKKKLDILSSIIHRHVVEQMRYKVEQLSEKKEKAVILDVPIPVKHGFLDLCDQVWVVWAEESVRLKRLRKRGMSEDEAKRRMQMQMTKEEYLKLADREIDNSSSVEDLRQQVTVMFQQELSTRGIRYQEIDKADTEQAE